MALRMALAPSSPAGWAELVLLSVWVSVSDEVFFSLLQEVRNPLVRGREMTVVRSRESLEVVFIVWSGVSGLFEFVDFEGVVLSGEDGEIGGAALDDEPCGIVLTVFTAGESAVLALGFVVYCGCAKEDEAVVVVLEYKPAFALGAGCLFKEKAAVCTFEAAFEIWVFKHSESADLDGADISELQ